MIITWTTIYSVAVQAPGFELIGDKGCIAYFIAYVISCHGLAIAGFGMALMRLIWMEDGLSGLKYTCEKYIVKAEIGLGLFVIGIIFSGKLIILSTIHFKRSSIKIPLGKKYLL